MREIYACEAGAPDARANGRQTTATGKRSSVCTPEDRRALDTLLAELGLVPRRDGPIAFDEDAPLACVRRTIATPRMTHGAAPRIRP
jgi:hypothetical protein